MRIRVWDTAGSDDSEVSPYRFGVHAAIIVYDITRQDSLRNTRYWFHILRGSSMSQNVFTVLAGNKADLVDRRQVAYEVICVCSHISGLRQA